MKKTALELLKDLAFVSGKGFRNPFPTIKNDEMIGKTQKWVNLSILLDDRDYKNEEIEDTVLHLFELLMIKEERRKVEYLGLCCSYDNISKQYTLWGLL